MAEILLTDISRIRFNALAGYCKQPFSDIIGKEIRWLEAENEKILVVIIQDRTDRDFAAMLIARDLKERYRYVHMTDFVSTTIAAVVRAQKLVREALEQFDVARSQGDEQGTPVDFFKPVVPLNRLNGDFLKISSGGSFPSAGDLIRPMMRWYEDIDGNFVEQFQTTAFDARLWELYLFAALAESRYAFDKSKAIPDFCVRNAVGAVCIEATTVNVSIDESTGRPIPPPARGTPDQLKDFVRNYMPVRLSKSLKGKLKMRYWEHEHVKGKPLVLAVQDFHAPNSMKDSRDAVPIYLYGTAWEIDEASREGVSVPVRRHRWGNKTVASSFFTLPESENISAVIYNSTANLAKFERMGRLAGFGMGVDSSIDSDAEWVNELPDEILGKGEDETWMSGMEIFHNPKAVTPLPEYMFPTAYNWRIRDGFLECLPPGPSLAEMLG